MAKSFLLDQDAWDLLLSATGDIAVAEDPYALAQDAACAIRLFAGELWYDTSKGLPYFTDILGKAPPISYMNAKFEAAALTVPGVVAARSFISSITGREVKGQVQVTDNEGRTSFVNF